MSELDRGGSKPNSMVHQLTDQAGGEKAHTQLVGLWEFHIFMSLSSPCQVSTGYPRPSKAGCMQQSEHVTALLHLTMDTETTPASQIILSGISVFQAAMSGVPVALLPISDLQKAPLVEFSNPRPHPSPLRSSLLSRSPPCWLTGES